MQKTSILYVTLTWVRAGVEEHILTLLRGLDRNLFRVHLAATTPLLEALGADVPSDVERFACNPDTLGWLREGARLASYLRGRQIDIVHSHMFRSSLFASPVASICRVPLVLETSHGPEAWRSGWLKRSFLVDRIANCFVDCTIAVSEANAGYLRNQKRIDGRKIVVIRNGCDLDRFRPDHPAPQGLRCGLGIGEDDPVILFAGRLEPQKDPATLLRAIAKVVPEFPNVRVVCLGDGSLRPALEQQAAAAGIAGNIRFAGFQSNIDDWLALAEFTVLPSLYEGLPLVAVESLAAGRTMIATAVSGTPEVIVHEKTGLLVPPRDPAALSEAICRLLRDGELRRRLAVAGREWVLTHFSQENQVLTTQALYLQDGVKRGESVRGMPFQQAHGKDPKQVTTIHLGSS